MSNAKTETTSNPAEQQRARTPADFLKQHGVDATRSNETRVFPEDLVLASKPSDINYDSREKLEPEADFVADIRANGVRDKIIVVAKVNKDGTVSMLVFAGRQRTNAARLVNKERIAAGEKPRTVPIEVRKEDEIPTILLASMSENYKRAESVMSKAVKVRKALDAGNTKESIRLALHCAPNTVDDLLKFLELSTDVQQAIENKELPLGNIKDMAAVPKADQSAALASVRGSNATKSHEIKAVLAGKKGEKVNLPETKKVLSRVKIEQWCAALHTEYGDDPQAQMGVMVLSFILGYQGSLKKLPTLKQAAEMCGIATREGQEDSVKAAHEHVEGMDF